MRTETDISSSTAPLLAVGARAALADDLMQALEADGFVPVRALSDGHARALAQMRAPTAVLVADYESTRLSGTLLKEIRQTAPPRSAWDPCVPVLVLSDRGGQLDLLRAFECGADDFLALPPNYLELRVRLRALLRRGPERVYHHRRLHVGALEIDTATRAVAVQGRPLCLSRLEFELLTHLAQEPERVFTKQELLREVWGFRAQGATRTLDSHASRLRRKLSGAGGSWVINVWGVGYRLT